MRMTRYSWPDGSDRISCEMTFTTLPSASAIRTGSFGSCLMRSHSRYPLGLSVSALRSPSESTGSPPASSICIISDVPERGSPETIVIICILQRNTLASRWLSLRFNSTTIYSLFQTALCGIVFLGHPPGHQAAFAFGNDDFVGARIANVAFAGAGHSHCAPTRLLITCLSIL